jgi:hypothetical protein
MLLYVTKMQFLVQAEALQILKTHDRDKTRELTS